MSAGLLAFLIAASASLLLTVPVRALAIRVGMVDLPGPRKVHLKPIPLLGGLAIYGGVMLAIQKGENISASLRGAVEPPIGAIHPTHSVLLGGIVLGFVFFYAAGMIGWAILFAMRRSGVHRLEETSAK